VTNKKLTIEQYVLVARSTAIYPESAAFTYPALGLCGEIGETIDLLLPTDEEVIVEVEVPLKHIIGELGDVLWYVTNTALDVGISLVELTDYVTGGLECETFGDVAFKRHVRADERTPFLKLIVYSGMIAEIAKKGLRDGYGKELPKAKRDYAILALSEILVGLCELCEMYNTSIDEIAQMNNKKLTDRQNRGKIKGDGDER